jgi:hypothetical protein
MVNHESYTMEIKPAVMKLAKITWISIIVLAILFQVIHGWSLWPTVTEAAVFLITLLVSFILFIFVHESAHALGFVVCGKVSWKDIEIGFKREALSPYMHCKVGVPINVYRLAILLPVILGAIPLIWGLVMGSMLVYVFGIFTFISGYGDILVLWVLKDAPASLVVKDHSEKLGCVVVRGE